MSRNYVLFLPLRIFYMNVHVTTTVTFQKALYKNAQPTIFKDRVSIDTKSLPNLSNVEKSSSVSAHFLELSEFEGKIEWGGLFCRGVIFA